MPVYKDNVVGRLIAECLEHAPRGAQADLARALNVRPQTVTKWIRGEVEPKPERWSAIEDALGLPRGALGETTQSDGPLPYAALDDRVSRLEDGFRQLSEQLAEVLAVLRDER